MRSVFALLLVVVLASGCRNVPGTAPGWTRQFGPVIGNDTIVGRTSAGRLVLVLTDRPELITIDALQRRSVHLAVSNRGADVLWGLARLSDGSLWTLAGQRALGKISADGRISERFALAAPHVGLFSAGSELVYQVLGFNPPADALVAGPPGEERRRSWGAIRTRRYHLARASEAALNLISCGGTDTAEVPCWFPDEPVVSLVQASGASRRLSLSGLPVVAPEVLITSANPARPIRDAFVSAPGDVWVLGSGAEVKEELHGMPGGRLLARYDGSGRLIRTAALPSAVRLILWAAADRCLVLDGDGYVVEVRL